MYQFTYFTNVNLTASDVRFRKQFLASGSLDQNWEMKKTDVSVLTKIYKRSEYQYLKEFKICSYTPTSENRNIKCTSVILQAKWAPTYRNWEKFLYNYEETMRWYTWQLSITMDDKDVIYFRFIAIFGITNSFNNVTFFWNVTM